MHWSGGDPVEEWFLVLRAVWEGRGGRGGVYQGVFMLESSEGGEESSAHFVGDGLRWLEGST